jgi:serine/threonine protein kinase
VLEIDDLEAGRLVENRYRLIQQLGDGGFAVVWEVEDTQANGDRKAIKFCRKRNFGAVIRFRNEFWTLNDLNCDRIVKVEALYPEQKPCEDDDFIEQHFFVMEKVEGITLTELIKTSIIEPDNQELSFGKSIWQFLFCRYPPLRSRITYIHITNWLEQLASSFKFKKQQSIQT